MYTYILALKKTTSVPKCSSSHHLCAVILAMNLPSPILSRVKLSLFHRSHGAMLLALAWLSACSSKKCPKKLPQNRRWLLFKMHFNQKKRTQKSHSHPLPDYSRNNRSLLLSKNTDLSHSQRCSFSSVAPLAEPISRLLFFFKYPFPHLYSLI